LNQAWEFYSRVFRRINKQLTQITSLELEQVSPKLAQPPKEMILAVPGSYKPGSEIISIKGVQPTNINIIASKQRPRQVCGFWKKKKIFFL
jgi:FKBP12-rapamycin complex-associated protein